MTVLPKVINRFHDKYDFLSNFYYAPMIINSKIYTTVEHYFQSSKTNNEEDGERIRLAESPLDAKRLGRKVDLIYNWDNSSQFYMICGVRQKFHQDVCLATKLVRTGDAYLIEGNGWHDNIWGDCWCHKCEDIIGQNRLGKILMKIREELHGLYYTDPETD